MRGKRVLPPCARVVSSLAGPVVQPEGLSSDAIRRSSQRQLRREARVGDEDLQESGTSAPGGSRVRRRMLALSTAGAVLASKAMAAAATASAT